jgi:ABC-2 type transport system ATP-binding protein
MREAQADGRTVFLSSHILTEVQQLCDRVAILRDGQISATERVSDLVHVSFHWVTLRFREPVSAQLLAGVPGVTDVSEQENALRFRLTGDFDPVLRALNSYYVVGVQTEDPTLEEIFLTFYGTGKNSHQVMHMREADQAKEVAR